MPTRPGVTIEFDVPARMRDGVLLRANVYRPEGEGPWPTLLERTPYDKNGTGWIDPLAAARDGFLVVIQDTRGRAASEGEWRPLRFEREDGYDSVEWAARLPGSDGRVGMFGLSYPGNTQWMAAIEQPPSLSAIVPSMTWCEPLDGLLARGGALELGLAVVWTLQMAAEHLERLPISTEEAERRAVALIDDLDRIVEDGFHQLPVHDMPVLRRHEAPDLGTIGMLADPDVAGWFSSARRTLPWCHNSRQC